MARTVGIGHQDFYTTARKKICQILSDLYLEFSFLPEAGILDEREKKFFRDVTVDMNDATATFCWHQL